MTRGDLPSDCPDPSSGALRSPGRADRVLSRVPITEIKSQSVRILDVVLIGPAMIVGGLRLEGALGLFLIVSGLSTMLYNARNYDRIEVARRDIPS